MPWVTKFHFDALLKKEAYESLENNLISKRDLIKDNLMEASNYKGSLKVVVDNMEDLAGDYLVKYENKRDDYFVDFTSIEQNFYAFLSDLDIAISQSNSKKTEWAAKIYTQEWEEEED